MHQVNSLKSLNLTVTIVPLSGWVSRYFLSSLACPIFWLFWLPQWPCWRFLFLSVVSPLLRRSFPENKLWALDWLLDSASLHTWISNHWGRVTYQIHVYSGPLTQAVSHTIQMPLPKSWWYMSLLWLKREEYDGEIQLRELASISGIGNKK